MPELAKENRRQRHLATVLFKNGEKGSIEKKIKTTSPRLLVKPKLMSPNGQKSPKIKAKMRSKVKRGINPNSPSVNSSKKKVKDKNDKNMSDKKINKIKNYFESLNKPHDVPKSIEASKSKVDEEVMNTDDVKKVNVLDKVDAFELLMKSGGGTPGKKVKRLRKFSVRKFSVRK